MKRSKLYLSILFITLGLIIAIYGNRFLVNSEESNIKLNIPENTILSDQDNVCIYEEPDNTSLVIGLLNRYNAAVKFDEVGDLTQNVC